MEIPFTFGGCQYMCPGFKKKIFFSMNILHTYYMPKLLQAPGLRSDLEPTLIIVVVQSLSHVGHFTTPLDWSMPGSLVLHCLLEFAQICGQ